MCMANKACYRFWEFCDACGKVDIKRKRTSALTPTNQPQGGTLHPNGINRKGELIYLPG